MLLLGKLRYNPTRRDTNRTIFTGEMGN